MKLNYLPNIKSPQDIRNMSHEDLEVLCKELRYYTIDTITNIGGHLAPTLGVIELTVALHYIFNTPIASSICTLFLLDKSSADNSSWKFLEINLSYSSARLTRLIPVSNSIALFGFD